MNLLHSTLSVREENQPHPALVTFQPTGSSQTLTASYQQDGVFVQTVLSPFSIHVPVSYTHLDELLWIWQKKSNNIHDLNGHIWDEWADPDGSIGKAYGCLLYTSRCV